MYAIHNDPLHPTLIGSSPPINYDLQTDLQTNATHAFVSQFQLAVFLPGLNVFRQGGDLLSIELNLDDPANPQVGQTDIPLGLAPPNSLTSDGNLIFTSDASGLLIYTIEPLPAIPVAAEVQIPNGIGVEVLAGSFNIEPTTIIPGVDFDTLVWEMVLDRGQPGQMLTWETAVSGLQLGEARDVTLQTTIDFTTHGADGRIVLPAQNVFAEQVLAIDPGERTAQPGEAVEYMVTIVNPAGVDVTYDLAVSSVPQEWIDLAPQMFVPAGGSVDVPLTLTSDPFAALSDYSFLVHATRSGATGSVEATLKLEGDSLLPEADPQSRGVVVSLTPNAAVAGQGTAANFMARITNTGSVTDTFELSLLGLPAEFAVMLSQASVVVPPGASNFREVTLVVVPPPGSDPGDYPFHLVATSAEHGVSDQAAGAVTLGDVGVAVEFITDMGDPLETFELRITNTGQAADIFDLAVAAPAALVATLETNAVALQPGESQTVEIAIGAIDFAFPGPLDLIATATSHSNPAVRDGDAARVNIAATAGLAAAFEPPLRVLPEPGATTFLLRIDNLGNVEDEFTASIVGTAGPVTAVLIGLDGQPADSVPLFILPGLASGGFQLNANLSDFGSGSVTVLIASLRDPAITAETTAMVVAEEVTTPAFSLDCSPLRVGLNTCTILGGTPGGVVNLTLGVQPGERFLPKFGVMLDIVDPQIVAQGVVQPDGRAVVQFTIATAELLQIVRLQAFEQIPTVRTTNVEIVGLPLRAAGGAGPGGAAIATEVLPAMRAAAIARWETVGLTAPQRELLDTGSLTIAELPGDVLAQVVSHRVYLDPTAAGYGWFVDATPHNDAEFAVNVAATERQAAVGSSPAGRIDLLTAIMQEFGHLLGLADVTDAVSHDLMGAILPPGTRRWPAAASGSFHPLDVNRDGVISAADVLMIINHLNGQGTTWVGENTGLAALDVNADGLVSPLDAIMLINHLNGLANMPQAEEESGLYALPMLEPGDRNRELGRLEPSSRRSDGISHVPDLYAGQRRGGATELQQPESRRRVAHELRAQQATATRLSTCETNDWTRFTADADTWFRELAEASSLSLAPLEK